LLRSSSATVLEDGVQVGLAVVESRLEVVHLLVQAFHVLLDCFLVSCQTDFDVSLWASDKPRMDMSERVSSWLVGCASSHLSNTLVDIGVGWQTVEFGSSELEHAVFAALAVHLGLDNDHLLLAELGLLLNFLQELDTESACVGWVVPDRGIDLLHICRGHGHGGRRCVCLLYDNDLDDALGVAEVPISM
jgi:hypothetical protein